MTLYFPCIFVLSFPPDLCSHQTKITQAKVLFPDGTSTYYCTFATTDIGSHMHACKDILSSQKKAGTTHVIIAVAVAESTPLRGIMSCHVMSCHHVISWFFGKKTPLLAPPQLSCFQPRNESHGAIHANNNVYLSHIR
jgi:hypothetical protein